MLGPRIASAAVLIPLVLLLLWLGPQTTALATAIASIIGVYEFYTMAHQAPQHYRPFGWPGYLAAPAFSLAGYLRSPLLIVLILAGLLVLTFAGTQLRSSENPVHKTMDWTLSFFAPVYAGLPLGLLTFIRADRPNEQAFWWIILICVGTWGADTGGYFFGRWFGKHKLAPTISPKKTIEGAVGGVLVAMLGVGLVGGLALNIPIYWTLPLGIALAIVSIIGDLFESWVKRRFDTKDSGKLIPGHGGLLDRIDSFLAVTLLVYLFMAVYI